MFLLLFFMLFLLVGGVSGFGGFEYYLDRSGLDYSEAVLMLDGVSSLCLLMLFLCGSIALIFCVHYFVGSHVDGNLLWVMLSVFLVVMGGLVSSYGLLWTLIMWEYLGVVSFFLILFYSNAEGLRATVITLFASRFGDVCLFGLIYLGSLYWGGSLFLSSLLILLVVITKSACFPFISWLLEAMRAPTPVSSLVHSSTLVAAGVWFLFRYGSGFVCFPVELEFLFFTLALFSILASSLCSVVFFDLKKIVALSTCNNVSWCILFFVMGDAYLGLFQLLSHGVAKCYLFIALGDLMSVSSSAQDCRGVVSSCYGGVHLLFLQGVLVFSLCGLPFLGIFFSKHGLLGEVLWSYGVFSSFFLFAAFFMSFVYSFRFMGLLCGRGSLGLVSYGSLFLVGFFLSLLSSLLNFLCVVGVEEFLLVSGFYSFLLLLVQVVGGVLGLALCFLPLGRFFSLYGYFVWGCESLVSCFYYVGTSFFSLFLFLLYRWESGLLSFFYNSVCGGLFTLGSGWSSLKFLVILSGCLFFLVSLLV